MKVEGVDNEREEQMHFQRLEELRFQRAEQKRMRLASCPPDEWCWQYRTTYAKFDLQGLPTHDLDSNELTPEARRKLEDAYEHHLQGQQHVRHASVGSSLKF